MYTYSGSEQLDPPYFEDEDTDYMEQCEADKYDELRDDDLD